METRHCPNCGSPIMKSDMYCRECGAQLSGSDNTDSEGTRFVYDTQTTYDVTSAPGSFDTPTWPPVDRGRTDTVYVQSGQQTAPATTPLQYPPAKKGRLGSVLAAVGLLAVVAAALYFFVLKDGAPKLGAADTLTISFETAGGNTMEPLEIEEGEQVFTPADPTRFGYMFAGWYTDQNLTQTASFPFEPTEDMILYASWTQMVTETQTQDTANEVAQEPAPSTPTTTTANVATITVMGADGSVVTETIRRDGASERVIADSNYRALSENEVAALTDAERCIAWNEIIAASNGYCFMNSGLASYFATCSWYQPNPYADGGGDLSSTAAGNVELLQAMTNPWWRNLATY